MKTIEQVKEYFKYAKEVKSAYTGGNQQTVDITKNVKREIHKYGNDFWIDIEGYRGKNVCLYNTDTDQFAEIISYKDNPITHDDFNEYVVNDAEIVTPKHYDNSKGTIYKVATQRNWNPYLFDIVKRLERAEKKGEFESDLEKSINVIKLWLDERNKPNG
jgi:hypothetical protein